MPRRSITDPTCHKPSLSRIHPVKLGKPMQRRSKSNMYSTPITPSMISPYSYGEGGGSTVSILAFRLPIITVPISITLNDMDYMGQEGVVRQHLPPFQISSIFSDRTFPSNASHNCVFSNIFTKNDVIWTSILFHRDFQSALPATRDQI